MIELPVLIENIIEIVNVAIEMMLVFLYFSLLSKAKVNKAVLYLSYLLSTVILSATVLLTDNILVYLITTIILISSMSFICYDDSIRHKIFWNILFLLIISISEPIVIGLLCIANMGTPDEFLESGLGRYLGMVGTNIIYLWLIGLMHRIINKKIRELEPYEPISGTYKIRLDANECPENYPDFIKEEIKNAIDTIDFNRYPDPLAEKVVTAFADYYGINPKYVTAGNGSDELIFLIEAAFMEKGDRMLCVAPDFSMYKFYSSICEVECDTFIKSDDLSIDTDALIEKVNRDNIKLLLFSNPCNPTGQGMTAEDARRLVTSVNALVILDEAYMDFWDQSLINEVEKYSNLIIFRTASKAVGSAALRLGFAVANETISRAVKAVKSPYNVNTFSQVVGSIIYKNKDYLKNRQKTIVRNREKLYNDLLELSALSDDFKVYNSCANFVFVKTSFGKDLWNYLKDNSIVIRFMGDYIRISVGTEEENEELISCIKTYLSR